MRIKDFVESTGGLIVLLFTATLVFAGGATVVGICFPDREAIFQSLLGFANGFTGAMLLMIKQKGSPSVDASGKNVEVNVSAETKKDEQ